MTVPARLQGLLRPEAYPHPAQPIEVRETHISWVFLAGDYAYKVKKPVAFPFLDFSTLDQRAQACAEEVRLNRRLSPGLYLGVVEVVQGPGGAQIGGNGPRLEPAVRMRRLPEEGMLPNLLAAERARPELFSRLGRRLARFHRQAATGPGVDDFGRAAHLEALWRENFAQVEPWVDVAAPAWELAAARAAVDRELAARRSQFGRRVTQGRIRDGHGDLHSGSICVVNGRIVLFDCLEFSPQYRCGDVASEVAFLAMDLEHWGRPDLASRFVQAYVEASGDLEAPDLLPFYKAYRAFVRGKVTALRLQEAGLSAANQEHWRQEARAYFDLALTHLERRRPWLVVIAGLPGSGKSTLARELGRRLALLGLHTDVTRKQLAGLDPRQRLRVGFRSGLYGPEMTRRTYAAMRRRASHWLRRGVSVVLDGTYADRRERLAARAG